MVTAPFYKDHQASRAENKSACSTLRTDWKLLADRLAWRNCGVWLRADQLPEYASRVAQVLQTVLDPTERICEFGAANAGRPRVRTMLLNALGSNLVWGTFNGVFYRIGCPSSRGHGLVIFRAGRAAAEPSQPAYCRRFLHRCCLRRSSS